MKLGNLRQNGTLVPALIVRDAAYPLRLTIDPHSGALATAEGAPALVLEMTIASGLDNVYEEMLAAIDRGEIAPAPLESLGPPVPRPGKVICVGRNYAEHARETGSDIPTRPILFSKFATAVIGPYDDVVRPRDVDDLDYEAELCVVIGRRARHIARDRALDHVAGYCCANDVSARTAQLGLGDQWLRGKSFDTFCPIGPAIVTPDEIGDPQALRITTHVDGELRQDDVTANMTFDVATLISYCSDAFTLEPGDILLTGTPPGVALGRTPPPWLQPGQVCRIEIERIGHLANRIVEEATA